MSGFCSQLVPAKVAKKSVNAGLNNYILTQTIKKKSPLVKKMGTSCYFTSNCVSPPSKIKIEYIDEETACPDCLGLKCL